MATVRLPDLDTWSRMTDEPLTVRASSVGPVRLLLVDSPRFAEKRDVYTWTAEDERENQHRRKGTGHWDAHHLNLLLQRGALEAAIALARVPRGVPLPRRPRRVPARDRSRGGPPGAAAAGQPHGGHHPQRRRGIPPGDLGSRIACRFTGLDEAVIAKGVLRGKADPFLLAASYASLNTVSEQYAAEILAERDAEVAGGLGRAYRERGVPLTGITNGVDGDAWDPRHPRRSGLPAAFDPGSGDLAGKRACRQALTARVGPRSAAEQPQAPLFSFVGRLTGQKGIDVLQAAIRILAGSGDCPPFIVLGTGEAAAEGMMHALARDMADRVAFVAAWDPALADLIYAAADFLVVPSVYEPCGLADFHGQAVGAVPLVHAVGGLRKVRDGETGYSYGNQDPATLAAAIRRCARIHREDTRSARCGPAPGVPGNLRPPYLGPCAPGRLPAAVSDRSLMDREIILKTSVDVARIRRACRIVERVIRLLAPYVRPGFTTRELDGLAERFLRENGAEPSLKGYHGFPACLCASVNNVAAHGVPTSAPLEQGDVVTLDITVNVEGWHGDAAWTFLVGGARGRRHRRRAAARDRRLGGQRRRHPRRGGRQDLRRRGCGHPGGGAPVRLLRGRGLRRARHRPGHARGSPGAELRPAGHGDAASWPGMVFTIEPMVTLGSPRRSRRLPTAGRSRRATAASRRSSSTRWRCSATASRCSRSRATSPTHLDFPPELK